MLGFYKKFWWPRATKTNLATRTGGLDWSSHTKIFPSLFPGKKVEEAMIPRQIGRILAIRRYEAKQNALIDINMAKKRKTNECVRNITFEYTLHTYSRWIVMEVVWKFDEPNVTLRNWIFLKDVNWTLHRYYKETFERKESKMAGFKFPVKK